MNKAEISSNKTKRTKPTKKYNIFYFIFIFILILIYNSYNGIVLAAMLWIIHDSEETKKKIK